MLRLVETIIAPGRESDFAGRAGTLCFRTHTERGVRTNWWYANDVSAVAAAMRAEYPELEIAVISDETPAQERLGAGCTRLGDDPFDAWVANGYTMPRPIEDS